MRSRARLRALALNRAGIRGEGGGKFGEGMQMDSLPRRASGVWLPHREPWRVSLFTHASMFGRSVVAYGARPRGGAAGTCLGCALLATASRHPCARFVGSSARYGLARLGVSGHLPVILRKIAVVLA